MSGSKKYGIILILLLCVILNVLCSIICFSNPVYSKLCVRHLFLASMAWILYKRDNYNKVLICFLGVLSFVYLEFYRHKDLTPWIYNGAWHTQQYPVYFYSLLFVVFLLTLWRLISPYLNLRFIYWLGRNSWEIFLIQMFILSFLSVQHFHVTDSFALNQVLFIIFIFICSIGPVGLYRIIKHE